MKETQTDFARRVGRTVSVSHCNGQMLNENNEFVDVSGDLFGNFTPERATRKFRRDFDNQSITINNVEIERHYYSMTIEDFVNAAEITDAN